MVRGNWNPEVCEPKLRCRLCRRVVKSADMVRLNGIAPAHRVCADAANRAYTVGTAINAGQ